jgi:hypothetical protein
VQAAHLDYDQEFEPDPPSQADLDAYDSFQFVIGLLEQAGRRQHTAWALSTAMDSIRRSGRKWIRPDNCDSLLAAIARAHAGANLDFPDTYSRAKIDLGLEALAGVVMFQAGDDRYKALYRSAFLDMWDCARMFQNDCHNLSLMESIAERARIRQAAVTYDMRFAVDWAAL